jgi:hypothetical protein
MTRTPPNPFRSGFSACISPSKPPESGEPVPGNKPEATQPAQKPEQEVRSADDGPWGMFPN